MNVINLLMIFPFATSAIIESHSSFKKENEEASRIGSIAMAIGFIVLIMGFTVIVTIFFVYASPYSALSQDSDKDSLSDYVEHGLGTDPSKSDTDGDRLSDGAEVYNYFTNPLSVDTDSNVIPDNKN